MHELCEYLSRRYPRDFTVERHTQRVVGSGAFSDWGWDGQPAVKRVTMTALGVSYDVPLSVADGERAAERALEIAGLLCVRAACQQEDFADGLTQSARRSDRDGGRWVVHDLAFICADGGGPGTDGTYYFQAGSVSLPGELLLSRSAWSATTLTGVLPGFWRMQDKLGMPLDEIHISGHVPQCACKVFINGFGVLCWWGGGAGRQGGQLLGVCGIPTDG